MVADIKELMWKAAVTIVTLLATDAWAKAKAGAGSLWRRIRPGRADALEAEAPGARDEIPAADVRQAPGGAIAMRARASGRGRVYQAGRDLHIRGS